MIKKGDFSNDFSNDFKTESKMTKEEMIALINTAIKGQGSAVDSGSALGEILLELVDGAKAVEVENITEIDGAILDSLNCGDKVVKVTGKQKDAYIVSFKGEGVGGRICMICTCGSLIETVSYDFTADGWVYNSTDKWEKLVDGVKAVEVEDITGIDGAILDSLSCGDMVVKITGTQKHAYIVSYKGEGVGEGICMTYTDASLIETVSYDFTADGWDYNSTDKWEKEEEEET